MVLIVILFDNSVKVFPSVKAVGKLSSSGSRVLHVCFKDGHKKDIDLDKIFEWHITEFGDD